MEVDGDGRWGLIMVGLWVTKQESAFSDHHFSPLLGPYLLATLTSQTR
jgi:hypothetical protein